MAHLAGSWIGTCALLLALVGCGESSGPDQAKTEAKSTSKPTASNDSGTELGREAEIVTDEVIFAQGGHALLELPPPRDGWEVVHSKAGDTRRVTLFRGTPTSFTGYISVVFLPAGPANQTPEQVHERLSKLLTHGDLANMSSSGPPKSVDNNAGMLANNWSGPANAPVPERAWLAVVTDGPAAAGMLVRGANQVIDAELMPLAKAVIGNLLVGARVPNLPDLEPTVRLSGVWEYKSGLRTDWLTFDPRGYAHMHAPDDPSWLDIDVCFAIRRPLRTYRIEGNELVVEPYPADPNTATYRWKFAQTDAASELNEMSYRRIDQAPVTLAAGKWEYYESSNVGGSFSSDELVYELAADGTYTYSGGFRFMHDQASLDVPGQNEWSMSGFTGQVPATGKWRVEGNTLILDDGKHSSARSVFQSQHSEKTVYIDGLRFVRMK